MSASIPAVMIARDNGRICSQNSPAKQLLGNRAGDFCWDVLGTLKDTNNLPCRRDCVARLIGSGFNRALRTDIKIGGKRHSLSCVPVDGAVVCLLNDEAEEASKPWQNLTSREREVLELLALGETNGAVAKSLGISESTVRTHVEKMLSKLGARNRAALVANGFRLGFLS